MSVGNEGLGYSGTATFNQTGGTHAIAYGLTVGAGSGGTGTYNLSGGALSAGGETIGYSGSGTFTQTGGTNTIGGLGYLNIAQNSGSGVYNLGGGTLNATTIVNNDRFNYSGGALNSGFTNNPGATFTLSGVGERTVNGAVTNNGTVKVTGSTQGTTAVFTGAFVNNGVLDTDPARLDFLGDLTIGPSGSIHASAGDEYVLYQDFLINSSSTAGWTTSGADLIFTGSGTHLFSFSGLDLSWNGLSLENEATLDFSASGSFYASLLSGLIVNPDRSIANIVASAGFSVFYDPAQNPDLSGIYQLSGGGTLSPVPLPGAVLLGALGLSFAGWRLRRGTA